MLQLALFEYSLAHVYVLLGEAKKGMGDEDAAKLIDSAMKMPMGTLVKAIREKKLIQAEVLKRLGKFVTERNWLVHRARDSYSFALKDNESAYFRPS